MLAANVRSATAQCAGCYSNIALGPGSIFRLGSLELLLPLPGFIVMEDGVGRSGDELSEVWKIC